MPWSTPTLRVVREMVRGEVIGKLSGASFIGNSVLRVMADATAALSHLILRYVDWLAKQLLPDTAETEWLDRHGDIWLKNANLTKGRKGATYAEGSVTVTGTEGATVPQGEQLSSVVALYETIEQITIGDAATPVKVRALTAGVIGNLEPDEIISFSDTPIGIDGNATVVSMEGGTDQETNEELRTRVLTRIQNPPMGGCHTDFEQWALACPGVTRAWCYPLEMGIGTVTVRIMCDDLRAGNDGFPTDDDVVAARIYLDQMRPVAVKDFFLEAPVPFPIDFTIQGLTNNNEAVRAEIEKSVKAMMIERLRPGDTVYHSWISDAISSAIGEENHHELVFTTTPMTVPGYLATLGQITYV